MFGRLAETVGFLAGMAQAEEADRGYKEEAEFDEEFAAVGPGGGSVFQVWIGEEAVPEERSGGEINGEVEGLPKMAVETEAHVGSDDHKGEQVESNGADGVIEGLAGRMGGVEKVEEAKGGIFVQEEDGRVKDGKGEGEVAGQVVKAKIIEAAVRPGAVRAVAEGHKQSQEHVQRDGADSGEADVG